MNFQILKLNFFMVLTMIVFIKLNIVASENNVERFKRFIKTTCGYGYVPDNQTPCERCGTVKFLQNSRILGGVEAVPYSWPAQVSFNNCGGTLINSVTVLTAANCVSDNPSYYYLITVLVGAFDLTRRDLFPTQKMTIKEVIRHPQYDKLNQINDIALIILSNPVTFNDYVQPACFGLNLPLSNIPLFAAGWGPLTELGNRPKTLHNVQLDYYPKSTCSNVYKLDSKNSQLCAGFLAGGKGPCLDDTGGGLYFYDSTIKKYIVVGITSYAAGCGRPNNPGVYTSIPYYYDWIINNMQNVVNLRNGSDKICLKKLIFIINFALIPFYMMRI